MKRLLVAAVAASLLVVSCGKPEDEFVGHYEGKLDIPQEMIDMLVGFAKMGGANTEEMEAALAEGKFGLDLRADGTCAMTSDIQGKTESAEGTWTLSEEGDQVTLKIADVSAAASSMGFGKGGEDMVLDVSEDGTTLSIEETQMDMTFGISFTRK